MDLLLYFYVALGLVALGIAYLTNSKKTTEKVKNIAFYAGLLLSAVMAYLAYFAQPDNAIAMKIVIIVVAIAPLAALMLKHMEKEKTAYLILAPSLGALFALMF